MLRTQRPGAWAALGDEIDPQAARATQGSAILGRRYQYDQAGNLKGIDDLRNGATRYGYDRIGRILSASQPSLNERFAFDPAHNMLPVAGDGKDKASSQGLIKNNRLEVFEDQRFAYDTHGNLIEKKIGKHTIIQLEWDVEHQLQKATVTKAAQTDRPVKTETSYRYDAFGRRLEKKDAFGCTLFEWDGNRLLSEQRGSKHQLYLYEADSFAPLAQVQLNAQDSKPKQALAPASQAPAAIKLELSEDEDWQPRKTAQAFQEQMRALQLQTMARARGLQQQEQPADFEETLPPQEEQTEERSKVVSLQDWRVRYYHNDHLGTPRELSDEDGGIVWQATYRAWGNTLRVKATQPVTLQNQKRLAQTGRRPEAQNDPNAELQPIEQNLRFQGQYFDQETGLHYNRFRYYDPDVGRFVSQDPIGLAGGANNYQYAPNPAGWTDEFGLICKPSLIRYKPRDELKADAGSRQDAIDRAWALEKELVELTGQGTRNWSPSEIQSILNTPLGNKPGQLSSAMSRAGYTGHHINSVAGNGAFGTKWQGDPRNIVFLENFRHPNSTPMPNAYNEHFHAPQGHRGSTQNVSQGRLIDRRAMIEQAKRC